MKPNVYFAKSNLCNPQRVAEIRLALQDLDINVVEYEGGTYSNQKLIHSDYLIVCPYEEDIDYEGSYIGKGLHKQIEDFDDLDKTLVILPSSNTRLLVSKVAEIDINDEGDWKRKYATIQFDDTESVWLTSIFKFKEKSNTINNSRRYLLIKSL
jgi:hypothetical protein